MNWRQVSFHHITIMTFQSVSCRLFFKHVIRLLIAWPAVRIRPGEPNLSLKSKRTRSLPSLNPSDVMRRYTDCNCLQPFLLEKVLNSLGFLQIVGKCWLGHAIVHRFTESDHATSENKSCVDRCRPPILSPCLLNSTTLKTAPTAPGHIGTTSSSCSALDLKVTHQYLRYTSWWRWAKLFVLSLH